MKLPVLALATLLAVSGCAGEPAVDREPTRAADGRTSAAAGVERPDGKEPAEPGDATSARSDDSFAAAVYYLGDTERAGPRLYREFRRLSGEDHLTAAVNAALGSAEDGRQLAPRDGDYRTVWPALTVAEASFDGSGALRIDLGGDPESDLRERARGMTRREAELAVQQLVYTAQAAVQARAAVRFLIHGEPADRVLGVPTPGAVRQASPLQVLSHVSLTSPEQGAEVGDTLQVSGVGNSFEANLGWEIRRGDRVVDRGLVTMAGWMADRLFPFRTSVDVSALEPGSYTLWVTTDDPSGGTEGVGAMTDDREFRVG